MKKPNFFIIGAPKCGTTSLATWLAEHPSVFMSPIKESHYYSTDIERFRSIRTEKGYQRLFRGASAAHQAVGEASTWYLYSDVAVDNLIRVYPAAKIIVCLRNPVDMAYSLHGHRLFGGAERVQDFAAAWSVRGSSFYGPVCSLGTQLERLYRVVPRDQVLLVFLEDMKTNSRKAYKTILDFLEVPDDHRADFPVLNAAAETRWPNLNKVIAWLNRTKANLGLPPFRTGVWNRISRFPSRRGPLSEAMREQLVDYFCDEMSRIEAITGRDLRHWR